MFVDSLKEFFAVESLPEKDRVKYWLIKKYQNKVSNRIKEEAELLLIKGTTLWNDSFKVAVKVPNPFLSMLKKSEDTFGDCYIPVPIKFKMETSCIVCFFNPCRCKRR